MELTRRRFLIYAGSALPAGMLAGAQRWSLADTAPGANPDADAPAASLDSWGDVRAQFRLAPDYIHLAGLLLASHPGPVDAGIDLHRAALDANPALYAQENRRRLERRARRAAARYLGARTADIALTDSTTMGIALVYHGLAVRPDQELLTTDEDYYATHAALHYKERTSGAAHRRIALFRDSATVSEDEIVGRLLHAVRPKTRALALTWVHSKTGVKLPVRAIADALEPVNAERDPEDRVLVCLDGVHGLGVEDFRVTDLGCNFFMAGTHKWLFGPRGTGLIWGNPATQDAVAPLIPTFTPDNTWGGDMTPGGFKPFEHQWALREAFHFHEEIGKARVAARIHALNRQFKEGVAAMPHVRLHTPMDQRLSSGISCFDVDGLRPAEVVQRLRERGIIASTTPYTPSHARVTPGLYNTPEEIDITLRAIRDLA